VNQRMRRLLGRGLAWIVIAAPLAAGCAGNGPLASTKLAQAERAVDEAQQSGAAVSVPVELRTAEDKLKAARAAMANKDYDVAIRQSEQAAVDADYARARAVNERVKKMADEMRANIQTLRQELERLPQ
jgi:flagellar biosynthesis/type III secretory pathway protein FliH